jgi:hypothetical protein
MADREWFHNHISEIVEEAMEDLEWVEATVRVIDRVKSRHGGNVGGPIGVPDDYGFADRLDAPYEPSFTGEFRQGERPVRHHTTVRRVTSTGPRDFVPHPRNVVENLEWHHYHVFNTPANRRRRWLCTI